MLVTRGVGEMNSKKTGKVEIQQRRVEHGFTRYLRGIFKNFIKDGISIVRERVNQGWYSKLQCE